MNRFRLRKSTVLMATMAMILSSFAMSAAVFASEDYDLADSVEPLGIPASLVLNRGHMESLAFGGPIGLSWGEVDGRSTFAVFAFKDADSFDPNEAYAYIDGIDSPYMDINVNTAFSVNLSGGPFWFRVQAVADDGVSTLSEAKGPFWYGITHSDEFAYNPEGSFELYDNVNIPTIVLDSRRPYERESQGNIIGDVHVPWPNAAAVEEGITHADFQNAVLEVWQNFVNNSLTEEQRESLDPELGYRDIRIFVY